MSVQFVLVPIVIFLLVGILTVRCGATAHATIFAEEFHFDAVIDHYRYDHQERFSLRYFVNDTFYSNGPVLFYAGNEAPITQFIENSGALLEWAQQLNGLVVFAEHRYYGTSFPSKDDLSYLSVEQALADYNTLNKYLTERLNLTSCTPWIALGGSYGANLALWLRLKFPHLWAGAVASSNTPLKHKLRSTNDFHRILHDVYYNVSSLCPDLIRNGWKELYSNAESEHGRRHIQDQLGLCRPPENPNFLHNWIMDGLETMVQYGYPYPTSFYNPLPGYPFRMACLGMLNATSGLGALRAAVDVYYNYTGQAGSCYDFGGSNNQAVLSTAMTSRRQLDQTMHSWGYQECTEVYQPMPTNGVTDFELPYTPNQTEYYLSCQKRFGVKPRPDWEELMFGSDHIRAGSNLFLTSGQLDPWSAGGITVVPTGASPSITIRIIQGGAHHFDLRGSHPLDPPSVTVVRQEEREGMEAWSREWRQFC